MLSLKGNLEDERDSGYTSDTSRTMDVLEAERKGEMTEAEGEIKGLNTECVNDSVGDKMQTRRDAVGGELDSELCGENHLSSGDSSTKKAISKGVTFKLPAGHTAGDIKMDPEESDECEEDKEVRSIMDMDVDSISSNDIPEMGDRFRQNSLLSDISHFTVKSNPVRMDVLEITRSTSQCSYVDETPELDNDNFGGTFRNDSRIDDSIQQDPNDKRQDNVKPTADVTHSLTEEQWQTTDGLSSVRLPVLSCPKYRVIGEPQLKRNRPKRRKPEKNWRTPRLVKLGTLAGNKHNSVDTRTIYSEKNRKLWSAVTSDDPILPPLECSPRFKAHHPEARLVNEKGIIMKDFFSTGKLKHFVQDKAIIPNVYNEYFECSQRKQDYIGSMYTETLRRKDVYRTGCCSPWKGPSCQFCDVIGNKYCRSCIESMTKHFAVKYEQNVGRNIVPRKGEGEGLTPSKLAKMSQSLSRMEIESKRTNREVRTQLAALALSPRKSKESISRC